MIVIFLRHGEAEDAAGPGGDEARELTAQGQKETEIVAAALDRMHLRPRLLLTSPLVRAVQTAQVAAGELKGAPEPVEVKSLAPGHLWPDVKRDILKLGKEQEVVLVCGHQPDMGQYLAQAIAQQHGSGLQISKSAAICVEWEEADLSSTGRICFALDPQSARRIMKLAGK